MCAPRVFAPPAWPVWTLSASPTREAEVTETMVAEVMAELVELEVPKTRE